MTGQVRILIQAGGTDDNDPMSLAPRWKSDPYEQFVREYIRATNWLDGNGQPYRLCWFNPCGYPREVTMRFDAYWLMCMQDPYYVDAVRKVIREFAPQCDLMAYVGCFAAYDWQYRRDVVRNVEAYACQGLTSIALDAMADETTNHGMRPLDGMAHAFHTVACEGQYRTSNHWMRDCGYPNIVMANWSPGQPDRYLPLQAGDSMLCTSVPTAMEGNKSTAEEKRLWRVGRARDAIRQGVDAIISVTDLGGTTYADLCG